jgi:Lrp/AsnC family leucine-responsive transcriptional regulator
MCRLLLHFRAPNRHLMHDIANFQHSISDIVQTNLDRTDLRMLGELQRNGRMPVVELADKVALSPTACQRRLRRLEETGIIERYAAVLNPSLLGQRIQAFVRVSIERQSRDAADAFANAIRRLPQVRACYVMTGDLDFLLHVMVPDLQDFAEFSMKILIGLPGVKDVRSSLVLEAVKQDEGVPLAAP